MASSKISKKKQKLKELYLQLVEDAYNFRQTDHELSDIAEYRAMQLLHRINKLKFLERDYSSLSS
ncbi:Lacal_2735 family protein [Winogradskyella jejuensis]|uniref:Lacal_2735 family protein n=1 Tax=Winogradskyella jejuensis TaxID=1089305 RepID=UPI00093535F3|nr:Lacal_2735 family protein [Winogradskyella jejuensis]